MSNLNSDLYYCRPRVVDDNALAHMIVNSYDTEQKRRRHTCDDEYRDEIQASRAYNEMPCGEFKLADLSFHDLFQKQYVDRFGKFIPMDRGWECPHCHTPYLMPYPPLNCKICGTESPLGEYVRLGYHRR